MALINCPECKKEISDTARKCPHCGYAVKSVVKDISTNKKTILKMTIAAIAVIVLVLAIDIFSRPNIKMDDFDIENSEIGTLLFLGIPTETEGDEWKYKDCGIKFCDIPVKMISYDLSEGKYHLMISGEYEDNLRNTIQKYCDFSDTVYLFSDYTYKELEVSVQYDTDFCFVFVD